MNGVMRVTLLALALALAWGCGGAVQAAPDEVLLGRDQGYPLGTAGNWYFDEKLRVGSFSHLSDIPGLFRGSTHTLQRAEQPMPLPRAAQAPDYRWSTGTQRNLSVDDFLARQRIMGLLIVKDGVVQVERYQYDRQPGDRFTSQSMAKSITGLAVGIALQERRIQSLDDAAERYAPSLRGTVYGATRLRNLLRMASGARYQQSDDGTDGDTLRFSAAISKDGQEAAARLVTERELPQGTRFSYASPHSATLAAVLRGATGQTLSDYLTPRLWQAIGAEHTAYWQADKTGLEIGFGNFNASLRDYARLGIVLANDGARTDLSPPHQVIPRDFLLDATDWQRGPEAFRPGRAQAVLGYGYQFWLYPGPQRRFSMLGVYGQSVFIVPALKLVVVQTAANATAQAGANSLGREREAFWRGVIAFHDPRPDAGKAAR